jgi:EAL domain-containing protein (putative c-di-GMP-specific phosphodiesterase class I)
MVYAKGSRGLVSLYTSEADPFQRRRLSLAGGMRQAIRSGQLVLHYQPKIDLHGGAVVAAEALMRWQHPEHGLLAPGSFIGLAERTGLIRGLTRWLLRAGLEQCAEWRTRGLELGLSVNLSARNLLEDDLPDELESLLEKLQVEPSKLTLEITESAILQDPERAMGTLARLAELGVDVAIDDFGTGYSSLTHLRLFPVRELKIDKAFVINMTSNENDEVIVRSTIDLAHNLGLKATAEGVENEQARDRLLAMGCDMAQGFFLARPMPVEELVQWAAGDRSAPSDG